MKKLVGKVTTEERDEIQSLFERRNGLTELANGNTRPPYLPPKKYVCKLRSNS